MHTLINGVLDTCMQLAMLHLHFMVFWINVGWIIAIFLFLLTINIISRLIEVLLKVLKVSHSVEDNEACLHKFSCDMNQFWIYVLTFICCLKSVWLWFEDLGLFEQRLCLVTEQLFCCMCVNDPINSLLYLLEQHCHCAGRSCCNAILMICRSDHDNMLTTHCSVQLFCSWKWFL